MKSDSKRTRGEVEAFKLKEDTHLYRINSQLKSKKFVFKPGRGQLIEKGGGKKRGIVLIPVESRVVQRSILNILQAQPKIKRYFEIPTSFGAIPERQGVPEAMQGVANGINNGANFFIKSDIANFFTKISIPYVLTLIEKDIKDKEFCEFLKNAINLEIHNLADLKEHIEFFEFDTAGVPQGCCLSPLFGNILLNEFDKEMNSGKITCLRYLDDFLILAPGEAEANKAFKTAQKLLKSHNLFAYDPKKDKSKASKGHIKTKFDFLGVEIKNGKFRPNKTNRTNIVEQVRQILTESEKADFSKVKERELENVSFVHTLHYIHKKLKGWGNQFFFCNDEAVFGSIESEIDELIKIYKNNYFKKHRLLEEQKIKDWKKQQRRLLGVHLLEDSKKLPIKIKP